MKIYKNVNVFEEALNRLRWIFDEFPNVICNISGGKDSLEWEPGAQLPENRIEALKELHENGIPVWVSLEPVISTEQTLEIIKTTSPYIDHYKVGKINHSKEYEVKVDWGKFLIDSVILFRRLNKPFYVKHSLQIFQSIELRSEEIDQDFLCVPPFHSDSPFPSIEV